MQSPLNRPRVGPVPAPALGGTLGVIALAFGIGVVGAFMLDLHGHQCDQCGHKWRHLGVFNGGDEPAHTCGRCGTVQWWKNGVPQAIKDAHRARPAPYVGHVWQPGPSANAFINTRPEFALTEGRRG
jgi:hypothetical protein